MEPDHLHIPLDLAHILGYCLLFLSIIWFAVFAYLHGKSIIEELKGSNGKWDAPEVVVIIWLFLFPVLVLSDVFIGFHASKEVWYSMDAIMAFALAGKAGLEYVRGKSPKPAAPISTDNKDKPSEAL